MNEEIKQYVAAREIQWELELLLEKQKKQGIDLGEISCLTMISPGKEEV